MVWPISLLLLLPIAFSYPLCLLFTRLSTFGFIHIGLPLDHLPPVVPIPLVPISLSPFPYGHSLNS